MAEAEKKSVIVTFKPKEQRPDKSKDKLEVVLSVASSEVNFLNVDDVTRGVTAPLDMPEELIGYDVNRHEAPIVMATLSQKEIDDLKKNENVATVEDDGPCYAVSGAQGPGALQIEGQPSLQAETIPAGIAQIKAPDAWDCSRGKAVKVGVVDSGIDYKHPDIDPNYKGGQSFVPTESSPMDFNSHGTHCAGTIAAAQNGSGVVGVAPAAALYALKVLDKSGNGMWSWLISAIDWALGQPQIQILSMSMGASVAPNAVETMCQAAWDKGVLLIAAAGNAGPPPPGGSNVIAPARYQSVVAVSAIDNANLIAGFSSVGSEVELCAPGVNVFSTIPGGGHGNKSGTSMACPHVSGAAALTWGAHRYADNKTIRRLLAWRSDDLGNPGRDDLYGFGRVDAEQSACEWSEPPPIGGIP